MPTIEELHRDLTALHDKYHGIEFNHEIMVRSVSTGNKLIYNLKTELECLMENITECTFITNDYVNGKVLEDETSDARADHADQERKTVLCEGQE